jgi:hypothetical protein
MKKNFFFFWIVDRQSRLKLEPALRSSRPQQPGVNNVIKLFFVRNLRIVVQGSKDKHSSLLRKFVKYWQQSFKTLGPGVNNAIKLFFLFHSWRGQIS